MEQRSREVHIEDFGDSAVAFERLASQRAAIEGRDVEQVNRGVSKAAANILAAVRSATPLRAALTQLSGRDLLQEVSDSALAAWHAEILCGKRRRNESIGKVAGEARDALARLRAVLDLLVALKLLDAGRLKHVPVPNGYAALAAALRTTADIVRDHEALVAAHTSVRMEEVEAAEVLASKLIAELGRHTSKPESDRTVRAKERDRAYTMMVRSYRVLRAALGWLRHAEGDAEVIAPGLERVSGRAGDEKPTNQDG